MQVRPTLIWLAVVCLLASGCSSPNTAAGARQQQQLYADIQKEMQAYEIRRQMDHGIREAEDSLRMPNAMSAVPDFR